MRRGPSMTLSFPPFTPAVKQLMIANGAIFLLFALLGAFAPTVAFIGEKILQLRGIDVIHGLIWQLVTYAFLHAGVMHILFMQFYFFCVIGAALVTVAVSFTGLLGVSPYTATVGASGGIYGLLLAFGILHGDSEVMLFPLPFLIKAKYFVMGIIALALYGALSSARGGGQSIAYMAHLGGALFGYIWLKFVPRRGFGFASSERWYGFRNSYYRWKRKRAARKFEVYMRKHDRGDYRHEDYFDELGNFRDPNTREPRKKNGDSTPPWVN